MGAGTKLMQRARVAALGTIPVLMLLALSAGLCVAQNTDEQNHLCNMYSMPDDLTRDLAAQALLAVSKDTQNHINYRYKETRSDPDLTRGAVAYGVCELHLSVDECHRCISYAYDRLLLWCVGNNSDGVTIWPEGAQITLVDCRIRYEIYDFDW